MENTGRLIIVSNRIPPEFSGELADRAKPVGGLVSAILPALKKLGGMWFGWSGKITTSQPSIKTNESTVDSIQFVSVDLSSTEAERYYTGFSNRTLWPLCHSFPTRISLEEEDYSAYKRVNEKFARNLIPYLREGDLIWIQDYHLIPLGKYLRNWGWRGRIGYFLHIPFPPYDIFAILPWAKALLADFFYYDLVGFHTGNYKKNFLDSLLAEFGGNVFNDIYRLNKKIIAVGAYPIGIEPEQFYKWSKLADVRKQAAKIKNFLGSKKIVLSVDRLDYTKGIIDRLKIFERFLQRYSSWIGKVSLLMISSPTRSGIPEYIGEKKKVDLLVGEINGKFAESDWTPITYLYRSYSQEDLTAFYLAADVCLVTPLKDGMNLVAKEYVAARKHDPGVLILSRFAGAAEELREALVINPYDIEGTARTIRDALEMSGRKKKNIWQSLLKMVEINSATSWRDLFLADLVSSPQNDDFPRPVHNPLASMAEIF